MAGKSRRPLGVRGRNSDNTLIREKLDRASNYPLKRGLEHTCKWIAAQVDKSTPEALTG